MSDKENWLCDCLEFLKAKKYIAFNQTYCLDERWADFLTQKQLKDSADVYALVQRTLRESYLENLESLRSYAEKVRHFNEIKKRIREELARARAALTDALAENETSITPYPITEIIIHEVSICGSGDLRTKEELKEYISCLEEHLSTVSEDPQLANIELQNMLQKQQQTLQMTSNIAKMLHDTAMAIIRKIGS